MPNLSESDAFTRRRASDELGRRRAVQGVQPETVLSSQASAVSWGAIFAGAVGAAALALILTMLGTGLGMSSVSPWTYSGVSATTLGVGAILWLTLTQLLASAMGGYIAGRLRTKWIATDADEVYFRDTAHGFLAWAISALLTAALLTSAIGSIVSSGFQAGGKAVADTADSAATAAGAEMAQYNNKEPLKYYIDSLFRTDINAVPTMAPSSIQEQTPAESAAEISRIFMNSLHNGPLPPQDVRYAGQIVAQRTGLAQQDAEKRVAETYIQIQGKMLGAEKTVKEAADSARKTSVYASLWYFIALLIGAFTASYAATFGGRLRDL
ncbi:hypothetical protein [Candidatus Methylobacter oryzae]|uniref:hypothetical protein n=1 Tax=Candidatus Methylobacter oryzae TaxID=2497749 RepID=UPI001F4F760D|nr:hypothetical protein [Candidatus Methylobacter oryzae]